MVMHFTDLALANSWLLYRKDHAICAGPKTRPIQFLQFRMEVATILLAQHHGADADLSTQSEEEEDSNQGVKRHVTELPHVSVRRRAPPPRDDRPEKCNALQTTRLHWKNPSALYYLQSVLVLANRAQLLLSLSHISDGSDSQVVYMFLGSSMFSDSVKVNQSGDLWASVSRPGPSVLSYRSLFYITNAKCHMSYCFFFFSLWCSKHISSLMQAWLFKMLWMFYILLQTYSVILQLFCSISNVPNTIFNCPKWAKMLFLLSDSQNMLNKCVYVLLMH